MKRDGVERIRTFDFKNVTAKHKFKQKWKEREKAKIKKEGKQLKTFRFRLSKVLLAVCERENR